METLGPDPGSSPSMTRRDLLRAGLVAGAGLSVAAALVPRRVQAQPPRRGGILRVRGYDPPHFATRSSSSSGS